MGVRRRIATGLAGPARGYVRHAPTEMLKPLLVRRLLEPSLRRVPRTFDTTTVDGIRMAGTTRDMIQRYVYVFGVWEPHLTAWMRTRLTQGRTLVDVGANVGYFSLLGSRLVGDAGLVVAIEALPSTFAELQANIDRNAADNVRALNVAATATAQTVTLYGGEAHNSGTTSTIAADGLRQLTSVEGLPLAQILRPEELATARVIKIDVEGGEVGVLQGLLPVIDDLPDDVELAVEVSPDESDGQGPVELLAERGFHPYLIPNDYALVSYTRRAAPAQPRRIHGPLRERSDLIFSRTDAETLA